MLPSEKAVTTIFPNPLQHKMQPADSAPTKRQLFPAWSAVEETKKATNAVTSEAAREFDLASKKAQSKTGHIEPWSRKYYAACTFGGMLACVRTSLHPVGNERLIE